MSERLPPAAEPEDHLGMTDEQWAWFQTCTHGYGEQDENGVDVSLLRENLRLTPTQRVEKLLQALPLDPRCQVVASKRSFRDLLAPLHAHNVSYVLMGVFAMACHGSAYVADHIDLACACEPNSLAALAEALALLHPRVRGAPEDLPFVLDARALRSGANLTLVTDAGNVDLLGDISGADSFEMLWKRSMEMDLFGVPVRVASLEDLIAMKRAGGRPWDQLHLMELERLHRLLAENKPSNPEGE